MKNISTLILFCLTFTFITVKAQTKAELAITIKDCRESKNYTYLSELKVLKNGVEYVTLKPQSKSNQILDALELGTYSLVYRTLFDKEQIFIVDITESKKYDYCTLLFFKLINNFIFSV